jgi:CubicO group peptidase (beta-lactamase class C family)
VHRSAITAALVWALLSPCPIEASDDARIREVERGLDLSTPEGVRHKVGVLEAQDLLNVPSVSIAVIEEGELAWAQAYGGATTDTLFQAASLSKTVAAVAALRLVQEQRLGLDENVDRWLTAWQVPETPLTRDHPVTLRGLLSMTGGVGVPGYVGYPVGSPLPDLVQILNGASPANSPPVTVTYVPGSRYAYSGGGFEIVQALIEAVTGQDFQTALSSLVLEPLGMGHSTFAQPLPAKRVRGAAQGHTADGRAIAGGWHVIAALAAGGLWSTPSDLARLLVDLMRAYQGGPGLLRLAMVRAMLTPVDGFPYGLGGAVSGAGRALVFMKRGQNVGYQSYMLFFPNARQGAVVMTNSDNGSLLAEVLIRRIAEVYGWPPLGPLHD